MSRNLHPIRTLVATVVGGAAGGLLCYALVGGFLANALGVTGLSALGFAMFGGWVGATLGAAAVLALVFRDDDSSQIRVMVLTVLAAGVLWGLLSVGVPGVLFGGALVLPLAALLGRHLATR